MQMSGAHREPGARGGADRERREAPPESAAPRARRSRIARVLVAIGQRVPMPAEAQHPDAHLLAASHRRRVHRHGPSARPRHASQTRRCSSAASGVLEQVESGLELHGDVATVTSDADARARRSAERDRHGHDDVERVAARVDRNPNRHVGGRERAPRAQARPSAPATARAARPADSLAANSSSVDSHPPARARRS